MKFSKLIIIAALSLMPMSAFAGAGDADAAIAKLTGQNPTSRCESVQPKEAKAGEKKYDADGNPIRTTVAVPGK